MHRTERAQFATPLFTHIQNAKHWPNARTSGYVESLVSLAQPASAVKALAKRRSRLQLPFTRATLRDAGRQWFVLGDSKRRATDSPSWFNRSSCACWLEPLFCCVVAASTRLDGPRRATSPSRLWRRAGPRNPRYNLC